MAQPNLADAPLFARLLFKLSLIAENGVGWLFGPLLRLVFIPRAHRWLFLFTVVLYWIVYDNMEHSYVSRIYQYDKYGIVIIYGLLVAITYFRFVGSPDRARFHDPSGTTQWIEGHLQWIDKVAQISSLLKLIIFALIFKNNTHESYRGQQVIHLFFALALGFFSLVQTHFMHWKQPGHSRTSLFTSLLLYAAAFQLSGWAADELKSMRDPSMADFNIWCWSAFFLVMIGFTSCFAKLHIEIYASPAKPSETTMAVRIVLIMIFNLIVLACHLIGPKPFFCFTTMFFEALAIQETI